MTKTLAVHLHLYYLDQLDGILLKLQNLRNVDYDLFVTMTCENATVFAKIKEFNPNANIFICENRGYDIGPFIDFLHKINLSDYKYILKLHSKGKYSRNYTHLNNMRFDNNQWGAVLWKALLANPQRVDQDLILLQDSKIGMLSSKYCINKEERNYKSLLSKINTTLEKIGLQETNQVEFVAGSMFYAKAELFRPLLKLQIDDFSMTNRDIKEGTLAHVVERVIGVVVKEQGYDMYGVNDWYPLFLCLKSAFKRFIFQRKITANNKLLIKVLKLPVYSKKIKEDFN